MNNSVRHIILGSVSRGWDFLTRRKLYVGMFCVPLFCAVFFLTLMSEGLPLRTPVGVVDLDHSSVSRQMTRSIGSAQLLSIAEQPTDYHSALTDVQSGRIFGFFLIPVDFQKDLVAGRKPTLTFYSNMTYFVPGTLSFKGFKTVAVSTAGGVAITKMQSLGVTDESTLTDMIQPIHFQVHGLHNPWTNYSVYLSNSFIPGALALMIVLMTAFSICVEIKDGTSVEWLGRADGSMVIALFGKLLPQTAIWTLIGWACQGMIFGFCNFPLNNHPAHMLLAMLLLVISCQGFAVTICEIIPNLRMALSVNALLGILAFSVAAFSFPVQSMYGPIAIFSYILPIRYYFLIYADQALNGIPIYWSRWYYVAMLAIAALPFLGLRKLRNHCLRPVYIP
ncbi:MAG: ABC transporter permease [Clostridium sp.]|nr:ABC transporter permease [Clostridium sp.]